MELSLMSKVLLKILRRNAENSTRNHSLESGILKMPRLMYQSQLWMMSIMITICRKKKTIKIIDYRLARSASSITTYDIHFSNISIFNVWLYYNGY